MTETETGASGVVTRIETAVSADIRDACYRLRYDVYVGEQGKPYPNADHRRRMLCDAMDHGSILLAACSDDGQVVGSMRVTFADHPAFREAYSDSLRLDVLAEGRHECISYASRLVVRPDYRHRNTFRQLIVAAYKTGAPPHVDLSLITCRPALVRLFEHVGYQSYAQAFHELGGGRQQPMFLITGDRERLVSVGSPFLTTLQQRITTHRDVEYLRALVYGMRQADLRAAASKGAS